MEEGVPIESKMISNRMGPHRRNKTQLSQVQDTMLVRTFGMFELTFLTSGPTSQTLIVALFSAVNSAGIRATQSMDAMAVVYTASMAVLLLIAPPPSTPPNSSPAPTMSGPRRRKEGLTNA